MYYVSLPRTLWGDKSEFGTWDIAKDNEGQYREFATIEEAKEYGESMTGYYYVIQIVG